MPTDIFFREVTSRICGNLDIEKALGDTFTYLQKHIQVDMIGLGFFEHTKGSIHVMAKCTREGSSNVWGDIGSIIPLGRDDSEYLLSIAPVKQSTIIVNRPDKELEPFLKVLPQLRKSSVILQTLDIRDVRVGSLIISADGPDRYSAKEASIIASVREPFAIATVNARRFMELTQIKNLLEEDNRALLSDIKRNMGVEVVGADLGLKDIMEQVQRIAPSGSPALILGETGTGKEIIANAIHRASPRHNGPMISMQCGAVPETLLDSELFGHEKGAFTGASGQKRGRFERAHNGTLFLDEIGELSLEAQVKLLRVLQEKRFERVGGTQSLEADVRIIAATHRDLEKMVREGTFREDLWYRLNVLPIHIPPLRLRREDIPPLVRYFVERKAREMNLARIPKVYSRDLARLQQYDWPGNVRELQNIVERALILSRGEHIVFPELAGKKDPAGHVSGAPENAADTSLTLDKAMARHIRAVLDEVYWKVAGKGGAAEILDLKPSTLRFRMNKLGIHKTTKTRK